MAHKKGVGSSKNGRESESKRLGVKLFLYRKSKQKLNKNIRFTKIKRRSAYC